MTARVVAERLVLIVSQIDQFIKGFDRYGFPKEDEQKLKDARFALLRLYLSRYQIKDVDIIDDEDVVVKQMLKNGSNYRKDLKRNRHRNEE
jgi:hypothetical protein